MGPKSIVNCWLQLFSYFPSLFLELLYIWMIVLILNYNCMSQGPFRFLKKWPYICMENINNTRTGREPCDWEPSQSSTMTQLGMLYQWDNSPSHGSPKGRPATQKRGKKSLFFWHSHTWFFFQEVETHGRLIVYQNPYEIRHSNFF